MEAGYCGKYLFVFDGQTCPLQQHKRRHETFFVVQGRVRMTFDNVSIPIGGNHRALGCELNYS